MLISRPRGSVNPFPINLARLIRKAEPFQGLSTMEIGGDIVRVGGHQGAKLRHGSLQIPGVAILHRQPVAGEGIIGIPRQHALQYFQPRNCLRIIGHATIPPKWPAPIFAPPAIPCRRWNQCPCPWATHGTGPATPPHSGLSNRNQRTWFPYAISATHGGDVPISGWMTPALTPFALQ